VIFWLAYMLLCVIAAYIGKDTRLGFWGVLVAGVFLTPVISLAIVILFGRSSSTGVK
jgi:hypothetical protein